MKRTEVLKAIRDAVNIFERLEEFTRAGGDLRGIMVLHSAKLYLELQHNDLRFVSKWIYWETFQKYRK